MVQITALPYLGFALFQVGAKRICLALATLLCAFFVPAEIFWCCPGRLTRFVFCHVFDLPALLEEDHGARLEKLRQGTLARKQTLWHCARLHAQDLMPGRICRRSSGVERAIGNGEADSSILSGGTISQAPLRLTH